MSNKTGFKLIVIIFLGLFIATSALNMTAIPFHDFDEAHRAEGARNMRLNNYFISPLVGGPYNRGEPSQRFYYDNSKTVYPARGRPPLVFSLMAFSSGIFQDTEWAYRLPSFILGLLGFAGFIWFAVAYENNKLNWPALMIGLVSFLTAYDWWHSMQMAHLDTGVAVFTGMAVLLLLVFAKHKQQKFLIFSGISLGLAILSKGPPAVVFLFPALYLLLIQKINLKQFLSLLAVAFVTILPWFIPFSLEHGWDAMWNMYFGSYLGSPTATKLGGGALGGTVDASQDAPIYWYLRWWFDTLRPGVYLFGSLFIYELIKNKLNWQKVSLLIYTLGTFALFSIAGSKVWWYVLPAIPGLIGYIYLASKSFLSNKKNGVLHLSLILVLASVPLFLFQSNLIALGFGLIISFGSLILLLINFNFKLSLKRQKIILSLAVIFSLTSFYLHFPEVKPPYPQMKELGRLYQEIAEPKCLWLDEELHYEAILYYSKAGNIDYWEPMTLESLESEVENGEDEVVSENCNHYLISEQEQKLPKVTEVEGVAIYRLTGSELDAP